MSGRSRHIWVAITAAASLTACGAAAGQPGANPRGQPPAQSASVAPADAFTGTIVSGTGRYAHANGAVRLNLAPRGSGNSRQLRISIAGAACGTRARCLRLSGTVSGTIRRRLGGIPDTGARFTVATAGRISPLGHVSVNGSANGTGNIAIGHESLTLTLGGARGSVTVAARSGRVPGFTSP